MSTTEMPAAEAAVVDETSESNHYEFAYHVLPTVAEGEVSIVADAVKAHVTDAGGTVTSEESPARIDLAYSIIKPIDGTNRKFSSAYFGWIRFELTGEKLSSLTEELEAMPELLRSLTIRLSRVEEEQPFFYHEMMANEKRVSTVGETEGESKKAEPKEPAAGAVEDEEDKEGDVVEEELEDSLEKITKDKE